MSDSFSRRCRHLQQGIPPTCALGVDLADVRLIDRPCILADPKWHPRLQGTCALREPMTEEDIREWMEPFVRAFEKLAAGQSPCCDGAGIVRRESERSAAVYCTQCGSLVEHVLKALPETALPETEEG